MKVYKPNLWNELLVPGDKTLRLRGARNVLAASRLKRALKYTEQGDEKKVNETLQAAAKIKGKKWTDKAFKDQLAEFKISQVVENLNKNKPFKALDLLYEIIKIKGYDWSWNKILERCPKATVETDAPPPKLKLDYLETMND